MNDDGEMINMIKGYCESKIDPCTEYLEDSDIGFVLGEESVAEDILWIIEHFEKKENCN
jgi:hypothetical protein